MPTEVLKAPTIDRAAEAQRATGADIAIVLVVKFDGSQIGWSSYGKDVKLCAVARVTGEVVQKAVELFYAETCAVMGEQQAMAS